jgi:hypothetical protein
MMEFRPFQKIARLSRDMIITEKIDGTNGIIAIGEDGEFQVGSRTRWIIPGDDNYGFAKWAHEHKEELMELGPGVHYGEWWGQGIQRNYGLKEKRFSLFNVSRWSDVRPACCCVVPIIYQGVFSTPAIDLTLNGLAKHGSYAAPGFMKTEGIVIFHVASGNIYKKTIENDDKHKGKL